MFYFAAENLSIAALDVASNFLSRQKEGLFADNLFTAIQ